MTRYRFEPQIPEAKAKFITLSRAMRASQWYARASLITLAIGLFLTRSVVLDDLLGSRGTWQFLADEPWIVLLVAVIVGSGLFGALIDSRLTDLINTNDLRVYEE